MSHPTDILYPRGRASFHIAESKDEAKVLKKIKTIEAGAVMKKYKELQSQLEINRIDNEGILREVRLYKKEIFIQDKKIDYTKGGMCD